MTECIWKCQTHDILVVHYLHSTVFNERLSCQIGMWCTCPCSCSFTAHTTPLVADSFYFFSFTGLLAFYVWCQWAPVTVCTLASDNDDDDDTHWSDWSDQRQRDRHTHIERKHYLCYSLCSLSGYNSEHTTHTTELTSDGGNHAPPVTAETESDIRSGIWSLRSVLEWRTAEPWRSEIPSTVDPLLAAACYWIHARWGEHRSKWRRQAPSTHDESCECDGTDTDYEANCTHVTNSATS